MFVGVVNFNLFGHKETLGDVFLPYFNLLIIRRRNSKKASG